MYCYMNRWTTLSIKSRTKREIERIALEHDMNQCEAVNMLVEEYRSNGRPSELHEKWRTEHQRREEDRENDDEDEIVLP